MTRNKKRNKKKGKSAGLAAFLIVAIVAIAAGSLFYLNLCNKPLDSANKEYVSIEIPNGTATIAIGRILQENGLIANADRFKLYAKIKGYDGAMKAGDYLLSPSMTAEEIMGLLKEGHQTTVRFTIPEGLTVQQVGAKLAEEGLVDFEAFMDEVKNGKFDYKYVSYLPSGDNRLEGFLMPNTYDVFKNADAHEIIDTMLGQFDLVYKDEYYSRATELGYDLNQIVTIASMIERETKVDSEREIVASVIYNRLKINMPLQIDATVQYALPEWKDRLSQKDLEVDSPYNTYQNTGLPIGPICSPGEKSIIAALYPASTDYIYYVLDPSMNGTHRFSKDYSTFLKNKQAYLDAIE